MKASTLAAIKLEVVNFVSEHFPHARVQMSGGYARDLFFGKTPKDLDLTVPVGEQNPEYMFRVSELLCDCLAKEGRSIEISQAYESATGDFNERIHTLIQIHCEDGSEVDIMFHRSECLFDVWTSYDSNVNKVSIHEGRFIWDEPPSPVRLLKPVTVKRAERIREIAGELGLPVDEESFENNIMDVPGFYEEL